MAPTVPPLLWRSLRIHQVYGANTGVGKTVLTTMLCRASKKIWSDSAIAYVKPVGTGPAHETDEMFKYAPGVQHKTLCQYEIPTSPHVAARVSEKPTISDHELLVRCRSAATEHAMRGDGWLFIETAGGVHSPAPSGTTQADLYMPLRAPVVLVGDSRLGGISQTISAFESLRMRGYDVEAVMMFKEEYYENHTYLSDYFRDRYEIPLIGVAEPPALNQNQQSDIDSMKSYYNKHSSAQSVREILTHLDLRHRRRIDNLETMAVKSHERIWFPFTQQKALSPENIAVIESARGDYLNTMIPQTQETGETQKSNQHGLLRASFDGSASWWTQGLGHGNPRLTLAAAYAAGRYGHVMFAQAVHEPALALAEALIKGMNNPRLSRVFYTDNGSTGVEVALKMALRASRCRYGWGAHDKIEVIGLKGSYHGDTIGAMNSSEPCLFNSEVEWYEGKGHWLDYPTVMCTGGKWIVDALHTEQRQEFFGGTQTPTFASLTDVFDLETRKKNGEHRPYEQHIQRIFDSLRDTGRKFGGLILEPVILGAGGMNLVDPLFQHVLVNLARRSSHIFGGNVHSETSSSSWNGLPVIFDEVFTGLYRLGRFNASSFIGADADISVHAKLLTGGLVPLCATLASEEIFEAFASDEKADALLHGHSYTAHPVGCQVALESLKELQKLDRCGDWDWAKQEQLGSSGVRSTASAPVWSVWSQDLATYLSQQAETVAGIWALGTVLAIHMRAADGPGYKSNAAMKLQQVLVSNHNADSKAGGIVNMHIRVLGNVLYIMAGQKTGPEDIKWLDRILRGAVNGSLLV